MLAQFLDQELLLELDEQLLLLVVVVRVWCHIAMEGVIESRSGRSAECWTGRRLLLLLLVAKVQQLVLFLTPVLHHEFVGQRPWDLHPIQLLFVDRLIEVNLAEHGSSNPCSLSLDLLLQYVCRHVGPLQLVQQRPLLHLSLHFFAYLSLLVLGLDEVGDDDDSM